MHKMISVLCRNGIAYCKKLLYHQYEAMIMKNHKIVNGELLQTNKKWSHLKQSQRIWIADITKKSHEKYI